MIIVVISIKIEHIGINIANRNRSTLCNIIPSMRGPSLCRKCTGPATELSMNCYPDWANCIILKYERNTSISKNNLGSGCNRTNC